jgi:hypothetical protein
MAHFSSGKHAKAYCDRCGDKHYLNDLKLEWTGLKVCDECWDPKDPLEFPTNFPIDPEAIENPRPGSEVEAGEGVVRTPSMIGKNFSGFELECELGEVTVSVET